MARTARWVWPELQGGCGQLELSMGTGCGWNCQWVLGVARTVNGYWVWLELSMGTGCGWNCQWVLGVVGTVSGDWVWLELSVGTGCG